MNRRKFLTILGSAGVVSALGTAKVAKASATHTFPYYDNSYGVLHDTSRCIGCRSCEEACNKINNLLFKRKKHIFYKVNLGQIVRNFQRNRIIFI